MNTNTNSNNNNNNNNNNNSNNSSSTSNTNINKTPTNINTQNINININNNNNNVNNNQTNNNQNNPNLITLLAHPGLLPQDSNAEPPEVEIAYCDLKTIGNGSFGIVFQASLQRPTQELIAIKKVLQDKRFKNRELQIMRKLDHCNVVKLKYFFHTIGDRGNSDLYLHLVLEFIPETLYKIARTHSRNRQNLPMLLVKLYMYQLFRSLNYIHSMDICHRDIKPQNLLLNPETGVLKLCDFGSAKSLVAGEANVAYICSRYYRAPELIFGANDYTTKIDIWSAGCVMAELILGETMFPGGNPVDQLVEIIKVLGTPSREQMKAMNPNYTEFRFPAIKARSWNRIFSCHNKTPPEAAKLVSNLLEYTPSNRLTPLAACAHPFFDELRSPSTQSLPNGRELPPLFDFKPEEFKKEPHLANSLLPSYIVSSSADHGVGTENSPRSGLGNPVASTSNCSSSSSSITNNTNTIINNNNLTSSGSNTSNSTPSSSATQLLNLHHQNMTASNINPDDSSNCGQRQASPPPPDSHKQQQHQQQQQSTQAHHGPKSSNSV